MSEFAQITEMTFEMSKFEHNVRCPMVKRRTDTESVKHLNIA